MATDSFGNSRTNHYQTVVPAQPSYSPTFDADGNELTSGAGQSYTWDVKNELTQIAQASGTSQFAYDPIGRRISETDNGTLSKQWVWDGNTMAEERNASNTVTKRFFAQGEQISGTACFYTRDHLGSVREMTTGTSGTILARYDYDPYGRPTQIRGTLTSDFQYAGYYEHAASGLNLTQYRAYDPITSRWLSRDPIGENGGINLYGYVLNDPINSIDSTGLNQTPVSGPGGGWVSDTVTHTCHRVGGGGGGGGGSPPRSPWWMPNTLSASGGDVFGAGISATLTDNSLDVTISGPFGFGLGGSASHDGTIGNQDGMSNGVDGSFGNGLVGGHGGGGSSWGGNYLEGGYGFGFGLGISGPFSYSFSIPESGPVGYVSPLGAEFGGYFGSF